MINYKEFVNVLESLTRSYKDDTTKCMELLKHFELFFDNIICQENKYIFECNSEKLKKLLNEADNVKRKLYHMEEKDGELLNKITIKYPLFYRELEFGITNKIIEKYLNVIYTMNYIIENKRVTYNVFHEIGLCAIEIISSLTNEFLYKDVPELEDLMMRINLQTIDTL